MGVSRANHFLDVLVGFIVIFFNQALKRFFNVIAKKEKQSHMKELSLR